MPDIDDIPIVTLLQDKIKAAKQASKQDSLGIPL